jgi:hypothetical protein
MKFLHFMRGVRGAFGPNGAPVSREFAKYASLQRSKILRPARNASRSDAGGRSVAGVA